ncbi:uncharacterized protein UV8b_00125 [Ustilaginoidea virens]|uniref:Uncharacterized protein n=1 Tax=Ustilaginoidea virens TaxID=1159556 RepID=A0A063BUS1_USTVR|nr:uncharacterized protein UV8b_00125 [Ustilaginoidea virens]QUC15884.1 hypothetical protein UV8b_00125 [Ustilaginoidea virens]GAO19465.1 hypothetical protein UVI_02064180 [Ustilaginoidea virens]
MSSTIAKEHSAQASDAKSRPGIQPVAILDSPLSKPVALVRPAVLLGLLALGFNDLVAEPVSTLRNALPVVALAQAAYAVVCLPIAGSSHTTTCKKLRPGEKRKVDANSANAISTAILALLLASLSTPIIHVLFVLFGAPFLDHVPHTLLCAAHFSLVGLFPIFYTRGVDGQALTTIAAAAAPLDETFGGLAGAVLGAWLGAVPIPLDWDREWQKWPVTILVGMYAGSMLGSWMSGALLYGKQLGETSSKDE